MFWNQVKKKKRKEKERERAGEKKREWEHVGMFLNEGEKENKRRGDRDSGHVSGGEKKEKKKEMKRMDESEMKERKNNIKNKKS